MPLNKKIIILFCVFAILFTCFSGCILQDIFGAASFSLDSYSIVDDEGFPAVSVFFTCSGRVNLKTFDTDSNMIDYDFFYRDGNTTLNLGKYRQTVSPGSYRFRVFDKNDKEIFSKTFSFKGIDLSIINCDQQWWENNGKYTLIGLKIYVENTGDLPVYPFYADIIAGSETYKGDILPDVVLPGFKKHVYCTFIHEGIFNTDSFEIVLKDKYNNDIAQGSFDFNVIDSVSTKYYDEGVDQTLEVPYPDFLYEYYSSIERVVVEDYSVFTLDSYDDAYLDFFLEKLISSFHGDFDLISDVEKIEYISGFVQAIEYKPDCEFDASFEYPNYPIETLFSEGSDCEDTAILTVSFLKRLGYNVALLRLPEHMAAAVKLDENAVSKYDFYTDGYYFLETTNKNTPLGFVPKDYQNPSEVYVYPIEQTEFVIHKWKNEVVTIFSKTESGDFVKVIAFVENLGNKTAENVEFQGLFYSSTGIILNSKSKSIEDISPGNKLKVILSIPLSTDIDSWFETRVIIDGDIVDTQKSKSSFS